MLQSIISTIGFWVLLPFALLFHYLTYTPGPVPKALDKECILWHSAENGESNAKEYLECLRNKYETQH